MPNDPTGLYWLGPLVASLATAVGALVVAVLAVALASPHARRNRAKARAARQRARDRRRAGVTGPIVTIPPGVQFVEVHITGGGGGGSAVNGRTAPVVEV